MEMADSTVDTTAPGDAATGSLSHLPQELQDAVQEIYDEPAGDVAGDGDSEGRKPTAIDAVGDEAEHEQKTSAGDAFDSAGDDEAASEAVEPVSEEAKAEGLSWQEELSYAKELGIDSRGMKRPGLQAAIIAKMQGRSQEDSRMRDLREQIVSRHEVDAADVADISDFDELQRFDRLMDRQLLGRQRADAQRLSEAADAETARTVQPADQQKEVQEIDWEELEEQIDVGAFTAIKAQHDRNVALEGRLGQIEKHLTDQVESSQIAQHDQIVRKFDAIVDDLDQKDLLGKGNQSTLSKEFQEKRAELWNAAVGLRGQNGIDKDTVVRALHATFHKELNEKQRRKSQTKLTAQSRRRIGGTSRVTSKSSFSGELEDDPELTALHESLMDSQ